MARTLIADPNGTIPHQQIRFCRAPDGVRLAYTAHGSGPPLVVVSCWLSHLQHDWHSPVWRHFLDDLGAITTLVRYDERGFGLSDWTVDDFSLDARTGDLETIIADLGLERFSLLGMSGGAPVAMRYAAEHADRVDRLIVYGGGACNACHVPPEEKELAFRALIRAGWAQPDPIFRRVFTNIYIPGATDEQMAWFDELQRMSTSAENAVVSRIARQHVDVRPLLPRIAAPTLVLHALEERAVTFDEGVEIAALVPNARLVPLPSKNHILLADEPAWGTFMDELRAFMADAAPPVADGGPGVGDLTAREREVLRLAADGRSNAEIAGVLALSVRTVERHLSNAYLKLGMTGKAARTAAVASLLRHDTA